MLKTGIDLVSIKRIEKSIKNIRFLQRVFSEEENALFKKKNFKAETVATNFAGKEAFAKALGTGVRGFSLKDVEILRDDLGAPFVRLSGNAKKLAEGYIISISLTHTDNDAGAFVVMLKDNR